LWGQKKQKGKQVVFDAVLVVFFVNLQKILKFLCKKLREWLTLMITPIKLFTRAA
jgi:hypothetical protein